VKTRLLLKQLVENLPYRVGRWTAYTPFSVRLGGDYSKFCDRINYFDNASSLEKYKFTIDHLNRIVQHAQANIPFYQDLYGKKIIEIRSLQDFKSLPVITKSQVREYAKESSGSMQVNTGGTSGEPLSFYVDRAAWAREWAHMHYIWGLKGYKQTDVLVTMLGKNLGEKPYRYNAVHNEFKLNPYVNAKDFATEIKDLFKKYPIRYFQGYPSSIYNFFRELESVLREDEIKEISNKIQSCFFSSEYPLPYMVDYLQNTWCLDYISWYGHSEMCILAYDANNESKYKPFITYGYAEEVGNVLVGTSFHNYEMPLIRYLTGDVIESKKDEYGLIESFVITEGREGDFIKDKKNKNVPLTALVFGRHHKIFDIADYLQVSQRKDGQVTFYITLKDESFVEEFKANDFFDLKNVAIDFDFVFLTSPVRTASGKLKLKISSEDILRGDL